MKRLTTSLFFFLLVYSIYSQDWSHQFHFDDRFRIDEESVICLDDGSCIISGEFSQLVKIDHAGNFLWRRNFEEDEILEIFRFRQLNADTLLAWGRGQRVAGTTFTELGVLLKLDTAGRILEKHQYAPSELGFDNFRPTSYSGFDIINDTLYIASLPSGQWTGIVFGLNPNGEIYWIKENPQHVYDLIADGEGHALGSALLNVYRIDVETGDLIWEINEQLTSTLVDRKGAYQHRDMFNILRNNDGDFLCASRDLAKINIDSDYLWEVDLRGNTYDITSMAGSYFIVKQDTIFEFDEDGIFVDTVVFSDKIIRNLETVGDQIFTFGWKSYNDEQGFFSYALAIDAWTPGNAFPTADTIIIDPAPSFEGNWFVFVIGGLERINLTWNDTEDETMYIIQRSSVDRYSLLDYDTFPANQTSFTDWNVDKGTTYYYRLKATNKNGQRISFTSSVEVLDAIKWTGSVDSIWSNPLNWESGQVPSATDEVWIPSGFDNSPTIIPATSAEVENLTIDNGATLSLQSSQNGNEYASLVVLGDLQNNGTINVNLESSIKLLGNRTGNGKETLSKTLLGQGALHGISAPFSDLTYSDIPADFIYSYDNPSSNYERPLDEDEIASGVGFFGGSNGDSFEIDLTGELNHGNIYVQLSKTIDGFNLIGNPYGSAISHDLFLNSSYNKTKITGSAYLWNDAGVNEGSKRGGDFIVINSIGAVGNINPDGGMTGNKSPDDFFELGSFQGFFVEAKSDGASVAFTPAMQLIDGNSDENFFRKSNIDIQLKMYVKNDEGYYETLIVLSDQASIAEDYSMDAKFFPSGSPLTIYSLSENQAYSILALPKVSSETAVPLHIEVKDSSNYELGVVSIQKQGDGIFLVDTWSGKKHELIEGFALEEQLLNDMEKNRWSILFTDQVLGRLKNDSENETIKIYGGCTNQTIFIEGLNEKKRVKIFDLTGKEIFKEDVSFVVGEAHINSSLNCNQIYLLKVDNSSIKFIVH